MDLFGSLKTCFHCRTITFFCTGFVFQEWMRGHDAREECYTRCRVATVSKGFIGRIAMQNIRCGLLLPMSYGLCVRVSLLVTTVSPAKTDEPIVCHLEYGLGWAERTMC